MRLACYLLFMFVVFDASPALALRCGTHLVSQGDSRDRVRHLCGDPTDISTRVEERAVRQAVPGLSATPTPPTAQQTTQGAQQTAVAVAVAVLVESWTFNFGPDREMQRVVFFNGVVDHIDAVGRGYHPDDLGIYGRGVHTGETRDRVRASWGEPTEHNVSVIERAVITRLGLNAQSAKVRVEVETWTYNLGPQRLMRRVVFEDGRVVQVETLGKGY